MVCLVVWLKVHVCITHKQAVEEDMNKDSEAAYNEVKQMIQELHIHDHGHVSSCERTAISHETHQKNHFIAHL